MLKLILFSSSSCSNLQGFDISLIWIGYQHKAQQMEILLRKKKAFLIYFKFNNEEEFRFSCVLNFLIIKFEINLVFFKSTIVRFVLISIPWSLGKVLSFGCEKIGGKYYEYLHKVNQKSFKYRHNFVHSQVYLWEENNFNEFSFFFEK